MTELPDPMGGDSRTSMPESSFPEWVIFHVPHDSAEIPGEVAAQFVLDAAALRQELLLMTDHHTPPRQNSCRPDRTRNQGGGDEGRKWLDTDKHSKTKRWPDCCRRRA